MDAVKFLKEQIRMCNSFGIDCRGCVMSSIRNEGELCPRTIKRCPEKAVSIVEKWSNEHPVNTRQIEFLKLFPNADIQNGVIRICPRNVDQNRITSEECDEFECVECRKKILA